VTPLYYGQHPRQAMPLGAFPHLSRVGYYLPVVEENYSSGVRRKRMHLIYEDELIKAAIEDDKDFAELLQLIISTGVLD